MKLYEICTNSFNCVMVQLVNYVYPRTFNSNSTFDPNLSKLITVFMKELSSSSVLVNKLSFSALFQKILICIFDTKL